MANEKPLFVQCPDCEAVFNVLFNGEEVVRCPNCSHYLYMSIEMQKLAQPEFESSHTGVPVAEAASYGQGHLAPLGPHAVVEGLPEERNRNLEDWNTSKIHKG